MKVNKNMCISLAFKCKSLNLLILFIYCIKPLHKYIIFIEEYLALKILLCKFLLKEKESCKRKY